MDMRRLAIAAAAALLALPAQAQDGLSEAQVRDFFNAAVGEAQQMVKSGDWAGMQSWHEKHLADNARLAVKGSVITQEGATFTYTASMDGEALSRFGHMMGGAGDGGANPIGDYNLTVDVRDVAELPNGTASAMVVFVETGTLAMPGRAAGAASAEGSDVPAESSVFHSVSTCSVRLAAGEAPDAAGVVELEMAACDTITTIG
jgi:hypothetical protein